MIRIENQNRILVICTVKSLSEALLFAEHGENILCTKIVGPKAEVLRP